MRVDVLFSGSRGNCTLIRDGETEILIDCGKSARTVCTSLRALGTDIKRISAIFITHEHSDHTSALEIVCKSNDIPVHVTDRSSWRFAYLESVARNLVVHDVEYTEEVGSLKIKSFPLPHDSDANVGYIIESADGDRLGLATDMGHVTEVCAENLTGCRRVIIEANHDVEMLMEGRYPASLKRRILSGKGHLSNEDCAYFVCKLAASGCRCFALAHLSPENNLPEIAFSEVRRALDAEGFTDAEVIVTSRDGIVSLP